MSGWQVKLCDPLANMAISERFRNGFIIRRYTNRYLLYFRPTLTLSD